MCPERRTLYEDEEVEFSSQTVGAVSVIGLIKSVPIVKPGVPEGMEETESLLVSPNLGEE